MSVIDDLKAQITSGRVTFDLTPTEPDRLKKELLGENAGTTKVTDKLQNLALEVSKLQKIQISSIIRNEGHHGTGRAFDVGNETIAKALLDVVATPTKVAALKIDEIIFDAKVADAANDRNKWNFDQGRKHVYDAATLDRHKDHIHFAVIA